MIFDEGLERTVHMLVEILIKGLVRDTLLADIKTLRTNLKAR